MIDNIKLHIKVTMKYFITPSLIKHKYIRVCVCMYVTVCAKNMETCKVKCVI